MGDFYGRDGTPMTMEEYVAKLTDRDYKRVAVTEIPGGHVSTCWLGMDHSFGLGGPPLVFETMVFGTNPLEGEQERYTTEAAAIAGHAAMVARCRAATFTAADPMTHPAPDAAGVPAPDDAPPFDAESMAKAMRPEIVGPRGAWERFKHGSDFARLELGELAILRWHAAERQLAAARASRDRLAALLREHDRTATTCPVCGQWMPFVHGHAPGCELQAALADAKES